MKKKVLFILKRREDYGVEHYSHEGLTTGLYNSAMFVKNMLQKNRVESKLIVVIDNNDIDREVTLFKPTHVIIEGLWVVPEKFEILKKLHPRVKWIIRIHSNTPFLANEGIAFDWIAKYTKYLNVKVATNAPQMHNELQLYVKQQYSLTPIKEENNVINLPNYYPEKFVKKTASPFKNSEYINIGCFGAIRPLKNHMTQAIAAVKFADRLNKKLIFHINVGRIEQNGLSVYNVERLEGTDPNNPDYVKYKVELDRFGKKEYEQYEMAHFRMLSDTNFLPYGKGMIEGARRIWKQLSLMEDLLLDII